MIDREQLLAEADETADALKALRERLAAESCRPPKKSVDSPEIPVRIGVVGIQHVRLMVGPEPPAGGQDRKILNPARLKAFAQLEMCGACHGKPPRDTDLSALQLSEPTPQMARYPSRRLVLSRCFSESADGLKCTSCHNPHINVSERRALRDQPCIACPAKVCGPRPGSARYSSPIACPVTCRKSGRCCTSSSLIIGFGWHG